MDAKEKWLKKLIKYREKIANNKELSTKDITELLNALFIHQNVSDEHELENLIVFELKHKLELIKPQLSKYFECHEDKIKIGDLICENDKSYNYLVVLGDVNCLGCKNINFKNLRYVYGDFEASRATNLQLDNLAMIGNNAYFSNTAEIKLLHLMYVGNDACFRNSDAMLNAFMEVNGTKYGLDNDELYKRSRR